MKFIRSRLVKDHTAATEVLTCDLPVNPLSHIIFSLEVYNATDEATLAELLAFINKIEVLHSGGTVFSLVSEDIAALNKYLYHSNPVLTANLATDNETRSLTLIIPFGRKIFDPTECFKATKKGELTLYVDMTAPSSSCDNGVVNIETVELIGATPSKYLKCTSKVVTAPGATGDNDVDLPIGNKIAAVQVRMTTFPTTSSHTYGVDTAKILLNNQEEGFSSVRAQSLVGERIFFGESLPRDIAAFGNLLPANIVWLDFDPTKDGKFFLETEGASSLKARLGMGVDEATYLSIFEIVEV